MYRDNPDVSDVDDSTFLLTDLIISAQQRISHFWIQFLSNCDFDLMKKRRLHAGLFDTLLPTNCAKNGAVEEEFMQLYGNYSQFLHANNVMLHDTSGMSALAQYRLWVAKWKREFSSSTDSSTDRIATLSFCDPNVFPSIYALLTIASILLVSTPTVEGNFSSLRLLKTYLRNRTTEGRLNSLAMMYIYDTEPIDVDQGAYIYKRPDVDRVIERFNLPV